MAQCWHCYKSYKSIDSPYFFSLFLPFFVFLFLFSLSFFHFSCLLNFMFRMLGQCWLIIKEIFQKLWFTFSLGLILRRVNMCKCMPSILLFPYFFSFSFFLLLHFSSFLFLFLSIFSFLFFHIYFFSFLFLFLSISFPFYFFY